MNENYLYKCDDCGTVQATREDLGESTWILYCCSIRCQGMVKEHYRLDFIYNYSIAEGSEVSVLCRKEVMGDDTDKDETKKIDVDRS